MSKRLTMKELKASIDGIQFEVKGLRADFGQMKTDLGIMQTDLGLMKNDMGQMQAGLNRVENTMNTNFSNLQSSVDRYLKRTETWHEEHIILKARHDRLSNALIDKKIVTKEETLL